MTNTLKIIKYTFFDVLRSRWAILYFLFFLLSSFSLLYFSDSLHKSIVSLMNITIIITPLISTVFSVMHFYNSRDFIELLLAQPITRKSIFLGQYFGLSLSLCLSFSLGVLLPFFYYGLTVSGDIWSFLFLVLSGVLLTLIFSSVSFIISAVNENRIKGFGMAILFWLYMAVIYDGMLLLFFVGFSDYPLEKITVVLSMLNPIDLCRLMILLKLDISALLGYTGAVFNDFFGTFTGLLLSLSALCGWFLIPTLFFIRLVKRKDF